MHFTPYLTLSLAALASAKATVYLIRHGEKPDDGDGLSAQGQQRAQCLRNVFGASSQYNIGHIMAQTPQSDGSQQRPYDTVAPLASDLGQTVDTSCQRDDSDCVGDAVNDYNGPGNILICWEHKQLNNLVKAINSKNDPPNCKYLDPRGRRCEFSGHRLITLIDPDDSYNIIWTDPPNYSDITSETSENCPGLDN